MYLFLRTNPILYASSMSTINHDSLQNLCEFELERLGDDRFRYQNTCYTSLPKYNNAFLSSGIEPRVENLATLSTELQRR